jgi:biotin transport system substrate-specific component
VAWLSVVVGGLTEAIRLGLLPFLLGDAIKLIGASLALPAAWRLVGPDPGQAERHNPPTLRGYKL